MNKSTLTHHTAADSRYKFTVCYPEVDRERERNAGGNAEMLAMLKPTLSNFSYLPGHLLCTNETVISHFSAFKRETFL